MQLAYPESRMGQQTYVVVFLRMAWACKKIHFKKIHDYAQSAHMNKHVELHNNRLHLNIYILDESLELWHC